MEEIRFTPPSRLCEADFGSVVHVKGEDDQLTLWVQLSKDRKHPDWRKASDLLITIFKKDLLDEEFIGILINWVMGTPPPRLDSLVPKITR